MNSTLTGIDKEYSFSPCDGFTFLITGLSGLPNSLGHKAIGAIESIFNSLAALIKKIVVYIFDNFFDSSTDPYGHFKALKEVMRQKSSLYMTDQTGKHQETLLSLLGHGGSKKAFKLEGGRALLLPNMDAKPIEVVAEYWERMVLEEVKMSNILSRVGLLSPLSEQVSITINEASERVIPAYISQSFENLMITKGYFIIDTKMRICSTWKNEVHSLFKSDEERLDPKNWDSAIESLLTDIVKICVHKIPVSIDSLNIAIVKKSSEITTCQYEVRYFGFDFSSNDMPLNISEIEGDPLDCPDMDRFTMLLARILDHVLFSEFGRRYDFGNESTRLKSFKNQLVQRYKEKTENLFQVL